MRIFLCGMMGAGKTTIGKKIASKLKLTFIDLDKLIEQHEQTSISEIFTTKGEAYFRNLETKYLKQLIETNSHAVIALGGGTPCFNQNIDLINKSGVSIFLNTEISKLVNRLWYAKLKRPLTKNLKSPDELKAFLQSKLKERLPYYQRCTISIDSGPDNLEILLEKLQHFYQQ